VVLEQLAEPSDPENLVKDQDILAKRRREFADASDWLSFAHDVVPPLHELLRV